MRENGELKKTIRFAEFELNAADRRLKRAGSLVALNAKAFDLLVFLAENGGRVVSKDEIFDAVWDGQFVEEANLTVQMSALRKALGERREAPRFLVTIPGKGYKFIAEVNHTDEEIVVEKHKISRFIVEEETGGAEIAEIPETSASTGRFQSKSKSLFLFAGLAAFGVCLALVFGVYKFFYANSRSEPFRKVKLTRLTNNGKATGATVSPNGKYVAYVLGESEGSSLWVQQIGTASDIRLVPPTKAEFWGLTFSPDGAFIYYNLFASDKVDVELFRVPLLGGVAEKIPNVSAFSITFAPDGKRLAYVQTDSGANQNYLVVADADGGNSQIIARKEYPNTFNFEGHTAAWSPDGSQIACLVSQFEADTNYSSIIGINLVDGTEKLLSERRWYDVDGIEWHKNGSGLLIAGKDKLPARNQIWFLPYPTGEPRPITNDLNQYSWLGVTSDGESLATLQTNTINSISIGEVGSDAVNFREIASEVSELYPLVFSPDGKIIFRSSKDGVSNLWMMDADGANHRQLTVGAQVDFRGLCISPDGKYIVFVSWRSGKSNLWRVTADGGNLTQLTDGEADAYPRCAPDGKTVVYQKGIYTKPTLWKVSITGGSSEQLTDFRAKWSAISTDGRRISYFQMSDGKWRIRIMSSENGAPLPEGQDVPANLRGSTVYWSADNQNLFYIGAVGSVGNLWSLPLDGLPAKPLTNFPTHSLPDFSLSPDGQRAAVTRSISVSDVVLIENETSP